MDIELNYISAGSGFPLILLHGNSESTECFSRQISVFSEKYNVIALDTRGHGKSPRGTEPFTIERFAEDLHEFMDEHKIKKAHILGFSDGGNIALIFALKYPEYVGKLILNGANLDTDGVEPDVQRYINKEYRRSSLLAPFSKKAKTKKQFMSLMIGQPNISPEELKNLNMPVLVLVGNHDMIKASHSELIARSIPNGRLVVLEGSHFIVAEASEEYNKTVLDFLAEG